MNKLCPICDLVQPAGHNCIVALRAEVVRLRRGVNEVEELKWCAICEDWWHGYEPTDECPNHDNELLAKLKK
jgi:hypothetical protein